MRVWTDKDGNKLNFKQFRKRFKDGVEGITPMQQTVTQMRGTNIILLGLICGLVISIYNIGTLWWLGLILVGGLFNTAMQWVGLYQKKQLLIRMEQTLTKSGEETNE